MLNVEIKEARTLLFALAAGSVTIGLLGTNFLDRSRPLETWVRIGFGILGAILFAAALLIRALRPTNEPITSIEDKQIRAPGSSQRSGVSEHLIQVARIAVAPHGWPEDSASVELAISCSHPERSIGLKEVAAARMQELGYSSETILGFKIAFGEAIANAFEHGCTAGSVILRAEISRQYASFSTINSGGKIFDLARELKEASIRLTNEGKSRRGRGLSVMLNLCDELVSIENGRGVKGVLAPTRVTYKVEYLENIAVATLVDGIENSSFGRRTAALVASESERDIILDFSRWKTGGTHVYTVVVDADAILCSAGRRVVALLYLPHHKCHSPIVGLEDLVAYDAKAAFERLGRRDLADQGAELIRISNRRQERD